MQCTLSRGNQRWHTLIYFKFLVFFGVVFEVIASKNRKHVILTHVKNPNTSPGKSCRNLWNPFTYVSFDDRIYHKLKVSFSTHSRRLAFSPWKHFIRTNNLAIHTKDVRGPLKSYVVIQCISDLMLNTNLNVFW